MTRSRDETRITIVRPDVVATEDLLKADAEDGLAEGGPRGSVGAAPGEPATPEQMRTVVAALLEEDPSTIGIDDDLIKHGIDSVRIMRLASEWRRLGADVTFADLIERPTLRDWWGLVSARRGVGTPVGPSPEVDEAAPFDLAPLQQAYWIGRADTHAWGGVGAHFYVELEGKSVEAARLDQAIRSLVARHGMLRARFLPNGVQQIMPDGRWRGVTVHDLRALTVAEADDAERSLRDLLSRRKLDVEHGEVFDVQLSLLRGDVTRVHVDIDMLVCDAQSFQVILDDLARLYAHPERPLEPIHYSFPRYLAEQATRRVGALERARSYWSERVTTLPGAPQLPLAIDRVEVGSRRVGRRFHWLSPEGRRALEEGARAHGLTLPVSLMAAFVEIVGAWSREPQFLLNLPLFDREDVHPDVPRLVGDFTNLVLLAVDVSDDLAFAEKARNLQTRLAEHIAHAEYSGLEVLRELARLRPGDDAIAPVVFTSSIGMGDLFSAAVRDCLGAPGWTTSETPQVWLDHQVTERDGGLLFNWDVVEDVFPEGVLDAMFDGFLKMLRWLGRSGADWTSSLPELLPRSQASVRARVNDTEGPVPDRPLHGRFFEHAASAPKRVAIRCADGTTLSYGALADRALRIAGLLAQRGVRSGDVVAVTMPRGPAQVAALLGVLAAGAAYVPIGVEQPIRRRALIHSDAGARLVLTDRKHQRRLEWPRSSEVLSVDESSNVSPLPAPEPLSNQSLAYVIYTSGSTGAPKGVEMTHLAAMNTISAVNRRFGVGRDDRVLAVSSFDFDLSVYDVFGLLSAGGDVVLVDDVHRSEARHWAHLVDRFGVTVWNSVPTILDMLLAASDGQELRSLRLALVSGDWIGLDLPGLLAERSDCRFVALGGATEAAIWSNAFEVEEVQPWWRSIPYGYPLPHQRYRVVDHSGRDRPDWVAGELWIGGLGLARGYRGDPEKTLSKFVKQGNERWYRTGDCGRYLPDGSLEFLGRTDFQVKVRGHRIELGEIEAVLQSHPDVVRAAVVVVRESGSQIGAAVVLRDPTLDVSALERFLRERLPSYMVPAAVVAVPKLPLTSNSKVDRAGVRALILEDSNSSEAHEPRGVIESTIAALWSELLSVPDVKREHNFFLLGGDSLIATRLVESLRLRFGVDISLRSFFDAPTVADLSALVEQQLPQKAEEGVI